MTADSREPGSVGRAFLDECRATFAAGQRKIGHCLDQLHDEQAWWRPTPEQNSIGNLILHLCGNVRQWIMSGVGGAPDVRNRPAEFAHRRPLTIAELRQRLAETLDEADAVLASVPPEHLLESCRVQGFDLFRLKIAFDCTTHFQGHVQEIICLTRMQLGEGYRFDFVPQTKEQGAP